MTLGRSWDRMGYGAIIHGSRIGAYCLIGMGAILLDGSVIGKECLIGAGCNRDGKQADSSALARAGKSPGKWYGSSGPTSWPCCTTALEIMSDMPRNTAKPPRPFHSVPDALRVRRLYADRLFQHFWSAAVVAWRQTHLGERSLAQFSPPEHRLDQCRQTGARTTESRQGAFSDGHRTNSSRTARATYLLLRIFSSKSRASSGLCPRASRGADDLENAQWRRKRSAMPFQDLRAWLLKQKRDWAGNRGLHLKALCGTTADLCGGRLYPPHWTASGTLPL